MQDMLLLAAVAATFCFGWFLMKKLDFFLENNCQSLNPQLQFEKNRLQNGFLSVPHDIIHFLRREMLDFTAFPVFFVSNLLLVQRKKYYFNRVTVSRNCSIVL